MCVRLSNPPIHQPLSFDIRIASLAEVNYEVSIISVQFPISQRTGVLCPLQPIFQLEYWSNRCDISPIQKMKTHISLNLLFTVLCFPLLRLNFRTIGNRTNDTGDFNARSDSLRPCCGPYLRKRFVQPDNHAVLDNQILKTIQFIAQNTNGLLCLKLNRMEHAPLKELCHPRCS